MMIKFKSTVATHLACMTWPSFFFAMCLAADCIRQMCHIWKTQAQSLHRGSGQTMNSYFVVYFKYNPFVKLYLQSFCQCFWILLSIMNVENVLSTVMHWITNKHTVLTNVFDEVTVTAQQSPTSVSVFAQSSPTKSEETLCLVINVTLIANPVSNSEQKSVSYLL